MNIKIVKKVIEVENLRSKVAETERALENAGTADEVRALGETLKALRKELDQAEKDLEKEGEENPAPAPGEERSYNPMRDFRQRAAYNTTAGQQSTDASDTVEYRTAFMEYVCRGVAIPTELRENLTTTTGDTGAVIPTTIVNEIVKNLESYGEIYSKVRHLNVQGGVKIPVLDLIPVANWIDETTPSEDQKLQANTSVVFNYFGIECKIAQSLLVNVTTLDIFQKEFATLATEAIVKVLEVSIFNGDGNGKCLGILKDERVKNVVTLTAEEFASWGSWQKKVFAKMKKRYRKGSFVMAQGTFDGHINGMTDDVGQPIGRVNYGIADAETYRFGGKEVLTVEDEVIADYETAASGDVVAVFVDLSKYGVNSNMQMTVVKWVDHDNNKVKNKAIVIVDGKLIDPNGVILIKKG